MQQTIVAINVLNETIEERLWKLCSVIDSTLSFNQHICKSPHAKAATRCCCKDSRLRHGCWEVRLL